MATPVWFGYQTNNLVVESEFLKCQVPAADQRLYEIMQRYFQRIIDEMPEDPGVLPSVRKAVAESMRDGDPNLARVAKKMAMSRRTLQRQMKEHATNFRKVMDDTRRRFALSYLKDRYPRLQTLDPLRETGFSQFIAALQRETRPFAN